MKLSGLYTLTNTVNGKYYFGSSRDLKERKYTHFSHLRCGRCLHKKLRSDYEIHGAESFVFEIVMFAPVELLPTLEETVLQELKPEYNTSLGHSGFKGILHSEETRKKMAVHMMGEKNPNYGKAPENIRSVIQKDLNGCFIAEHPSIAEAMRKTGALSTTIQAVCNGRGKTAGGFKWEYKI